MAAATAEKNALKTAAGQAGDFANQGQSGYGDMTNALGSQRKFYEDLMSGRGNSVVNEQLRQGLLQQQAAQQSMAAGASPQNSAMAARSAMMNMGRAQGNMAGQAALARLQEQQMAAEQLSGLNLGQRGQDANVGLQSRQNQMTGLGVNKPREPGTVEKVSAGIGMGLGLKKLSDKRLKTDIRDGDAVARRALEMLSAKTFRYKDPKHGKGERLGVLAQDLQSAGLGQTVKRTSEGLALDPGELSATNTAMLAALVKRIVKLEKDRK